MKKKLRKIPKLYYFIFLAVVALILGVAIPTVARYRNRALLADTDHWNGATATSYHAGTGSKEDPYLISNGAELSYFSKMLLTEDYNNTYFRLSNNILLNAGTFKYDEENGMQYIENGTTYYIKEYTNELYRTKDRTGNTEKTVFFFPALKNFKGHFDGSSYTIYGLYISSTEEEVSLFPNLEGEVHDLYVSNALVYGGEKTAGIASSLTNSTLKNISYDGFVIGNTQTEKKNHTLTLENQALTFDVDGEKTIAFNTNIPKLEGTITKVVLSGTCNQTQTDGKIQINGEEIPTCDKSSFEIDFGNHIPAELQMSSSLTENQELDLTDLKYTITYQTGVTGGIAGVSTNSILHNVINKSYVSSPTLASGLVGTSSGTLKVENSYNLGQIKSNLTSTGLVGTIQNSEDVKISKSYNTGELQGKDTIGLIDRITASKVVIQNSFQTFDSLYAIDSILSSTVTINNSYHTQGAAIRNGTSEGEFQIASPAQLKSKTFLIETLKFYEFIDEADLLSDASHIWTLEEGSYPVLFIDDIYDPLATIHVATYAWERFGIKLEPIYFSSQIMFSLEEKSEARPIQNIYYYIHNAQESLSKNKLEQVEEWIPYENVTSITTDGTYIIYAKIIDSEGHTSYINTDQLVLDTTPASLKIQTETNEWTTEKEEAEYTYIESITPFTIEATDDGAGIDKTEYYMTDHLLSKEELNNVTEWVAYQEAVSLDKKGTSIIYAKTVDKAGNTTYVNSSYIVYAGYEQTSISIGRTPTANLEDLTVTNRSTLSLVFAYQDDRPAASTTEHFLVSNTLLPAKTTMTIIDENSHKVYSHVVSSEETYQDTCEGECTTYIYPFKLFKEIGRVGDVGFFEEAQEQTKMDEKFTVILDFSNTENIDSLENIEIYPELRDEANNKVRSTLKDTRHKFSLLNDKNASLSIQSTYTGSTIPYNLDSTTTIPLQLGIDYKTMGDTIVQDSTYENKILGLAIRLLDENGKIVPKEQLKNLIFQVGEQTYSPSNDGITRINLQKPVQNLETSLILITEQSTTSSLKKGNYSLVIESYASYDGIYSDTFSINSKTIQLTVEESTNSISIPFTVKYPEEGKSLSRKDESIKLNVSVQEATNLSATNVRISLYKKNQFTAYNQSYSLIDLNQFTNTSLEQASDTSYYLLKTLASGKDNEVVLDINPSKFQPGGYKFVVELFEGNQKLSTKEEKFIVR